MKKRLYILAPNDRFNYGDLLFPYIVAHYLTLQFDDIKYVSTTKSDLSEKGGIPTEGYSSLFHTDPAWENHLIVAGGEALCVRWLPILSYINPNVNLLYRFAWKASKLIGSYSFDLFSSIVDFAFHTKTFFVFSVGKNELPQFKTIAYNALGGSGLLTNKTLTKKKAINILKSIDYFTVRDNDTSKALTEHGIQHSICPDTAIMMSEVFSEEFLLSHLTVPSTFSTEKYIFFQGNYQLWKEQNGLAAKQLEQLQNNTQYTICLCPISTALGHSDHIALQNIASCFTNRCKYVLIENPNIFDIMWLIKHSQTYIGSSLHGTIKAMSFNVPFIGYGPRKLGAYIEQWSDNPELYFCEKDQLYNTFIKQHTKHSNPNMDRQKSLVISAFNKLIKLYNNGKF